jgi:hypothetical protein
MSPLRICLTPKVSGTGGMVSFRRRLTAGLVQRGVQVGDDLDEGRYDAVLVIGGRASSWDCGASSSAACGLCNVWTV